MIKSYNIKLEFESIVADSPLDAAKKLSKLLKSAYSTGFDFAYDVEDKKTNSKYRVDLFQDTVTQKELN